MIIELPAHLREQIFVHAKSELPRECCGVIGGHANRATSVYQSENVAANPLVEYAAAPTDLFAAQRAMRERGETLVGIYHSHPQQSEPQPSAADIALAFYPNAVYFIVGFAQNETVLRAFKIYEREQRWKSVGFLIAD